MSHLRSLSVSPCLFPPHLTSLDLHLLPAQITQYIQQWPPKLTSLRIYCHPHAPEMPGPALPATLTAFQCGGVNPHRLEWIVPGKSHQCLDALSCPSSSIVSPFDTMLADCPALKSAAFSVQLHHLHGARAFFSWARSLTALHLNVDVPADGTLDVSVFPSGLNLLALFLRTRQSVVHLLGSFQPGSLLCDLRVRFRMS